MTETATSTETTTKEIAYKGCTISLKERDRGVFSGYFVSYKTADGVSHEVLSLTGKPCSFTTLTYAKQCITKHFAK